MSGKKPNAADRGHPCECGHGVLDHRPEGWHRCNECVCSEYQSASLPAPAVEPEQPTAEGCPTCGIPDTPSNNWFAYANGRRQGAKAERARIRRIVEGKAALNRLANVDAILAAIDGGDDA